MKSFEEITAGLDPEDRARVAGAIKLASIQALCAGDLRDGITTWSKSDSSPVTLADLLHQCQAQDMIAKHFPGDGLIAEEPRDLREEAMVEAREVSRTLYKIPLSEDLKELPETGDTVWIMDPIDGTKGYIARRYCAIAIGYFKGTEAYFGAMAVPEAPEGPRTSIELKTAFAVKGAGAWICDADKIDDGTFEKLDPGEPAEDAKLRVAISLEHGGSIGDRLAKRDDVEIVKLDSQAKYLAVAAGDIDVYMRQRRDDGQSDVTWDHLSGGMVALEAGCVVRNFTGSPVDFKPQAEIAFEGGVICHRGSAEGRVGKLVADLLKG